MIQVKTRDVAIYTLLCWWPSFCCCAGSGGCFISNDNIIVNDTDLEKGESVQLQTTLVSMECLCMHRWFIIFLSIILIDVNVQNPPLYMQWSSCDSVQYTNIASDSCLVQFCGGSASVPRGMVFPPVDLSSGTVLTALMFLPILVSWFSPIVSRATSTEDSTSALYWCSLKEFFSKELKKIVSCCTCTCWFDVSAPIRLALWLNAPGLPISLRIMQGLAMYNAVLLGRTCFFSQELAISSQLPSSSRLENFLELLKWFSRSE